VLAGPRSRDVLAACTKADVSNAGLRWLNGREMEVAGVPARVLRVGYVGELGYELHAPMARLPAIYDALRRAGAPYGLKLFGTYAMNALRIEKAYRGMGAELTNEVSLIEADMERFADLTKPDFTGKAATLSAKQQGPRIKLVYMSVDAEDADCLGAETVYQGGKPVGVTTSGGYGYATGKSLAFAYVDPALTAPGTRFEIEILGERRAAHIEQAPVYDPENLRLRG
jgi:dimethylglycine dehydrogenase